MKKNIIIKATLNGKNDFFAEPEPCEYTEEMKQRDLERCKEIEQRLSGRKFVHR